MDSSFFRLVLGPALLCLCLAAGTALAADAKISSETIKAKSALSSAQQQEVDRCVDDQIRIMVDPNSSDQAVVKAREAITGPFTQGGTDIFNTAYSTSLSRALPQTLKSERVIVRLNGVIAAGSLTDGGLVPIVKAGLADPNEGVRYWAAKAVAFANAAQPATATGPRLSPEAQADVLKVLTEALPKEASQPVVQQMFAGMAALTIPEANLKLLTVLNERVALHAADPDQPLTADLQGLTDVGQKIITNPTDETKRLITLVAYRYMALSASVLDHKAAGEKAAAEYKVMIDRADSLLRWAAKNKNVTPPPPIRNDLAADNWPAILLTTADAKGPTSWRNILQTAPFDFKPEELAVPAVGKGE